MTEEIYAENILEHYKNPHNKREIQNCPVKHKEYNPLCGDEITIFINVKDGKVVDASFMGKGCAISQASVSMLTDKIKGMTLEEAKALTKEDVFSLLGISLSPLRTKCALLSLKTVVKAIEEIETK